jgi:hypothetical protein
MVVALSVAYAWKAAVQILLGVPCLVLGLERRGQFGEGQAPIGAMFLLSAAFKLLSGRKPEARSWELVAGSW